MADAVRGFSEDEFSTALAEALRYFEYDSLKVEQTECIRRVICLREDVLAVLPTGFGKSLIYQIIPKMLKCLKNESDDTQKFIVCVVSPLEYTRKQQVASINKLHEEYPSPSLGLVWSRLENDFHVTFLQIVKCSQSWLSKYPLVREKESNN